MNEIKFEDLSKINQHLIIAYNKGYRVIDGEVFGPTGHKRKLGLKEGYHRFSIKHEKKSRQIGVHKLAAYQKFGWKMFQKGIEVRHLDGRSMNNKDYNIELGTRSQNEMDKDPSIRRRSAIKASEAVRKVPDEIAEQIKRDKRNGLSYNDLKEKYKKYDINSKGTLFSIVNTNYVTVKQMG